LCFSIVFPASVTAFVSISGFFILIHHFTKRLGYNEYKGSCDVFITFMKNQKNIHIKLNFMDEHTNKINLNV